MGRSFLTLGMLSGLWPSWCDGPMGWEGSVQAWLHGCWSLGFPLVDTESENAHDAHAHTPLGKEVFFNNYPSSPLLLTEPFTFRSLLSVTSSAPKESHVTSVPSHIDHFPTVASSTHPESHCHQRLFAPSRPINLQSLAKPVCGPLWLS